MEWAAGLHPGLVLGTGNSCASARQNGHSNLQEEELCLKVFDSGFYELEDINTCLQQRYAGSLKM